MRRVRGSGRDVLPLWLPESETRYLRLALRRGAPAGYALADVQAKSPIEWPSLNDALRSLARAAPRGRYPRTFVGEQNYWTLVGVDGGGAHAALISEDGAIEPRKAGPSIEPFVIDEAGQVSSWADVRIEHALRDGYLPLPQVRWAGNGFTLSIEAGADGAPERAQLIARYALTNTGTSRRTLSFALALRPWQVNPPTQLLNTPGGASAVRHVAWRGSTLRVDGRDWLHALTPPNAVGGAAFDQGDALELALHDALPPLVELGDAQSLAQRRAALAARACAGRVAQHRRGAADDGPCSGAYRCESAALDAIATAWRSRLNRVTLNMPAPAQPIVDTLRSALAQILISRDGAALQPGTRSYARTWVRDGAMMVAGLLRLGEVDAAREFVQWYAGYLFANGKVPCCVDGRGADPVAENDSHGQFIYAVAELWRYTRDRGLIEPLWPKVDAAARYMEQLRLSERTPANRSPGREAFYGLMPASISHEGYSAKPMHSYWDDFWALAGYRDAAELARLLGHHERAAELAATTRRVRVRLRRIDRHCGRPASHRLPARRGRARRLRPDLEHDDLQPGRHRDACAACAARVDVGAVLARMCRAARREARMERLHALRVALGLGVRAPRATRTRACSARLFLRDRRPAPWNQWAEVVGREPREQRFLGDMPHAWISSDYIRSALDLLAYVRDSDGALVLGAGIPPAWHRTGPVEVRGLRTAFGKLDFKLEREVPNVLRLVVGAGLERPPGGVWFAWPGSGEPPASTVDGAALQWQGKLLRLPDAGADLRFQLSAADAAR